MPKKRTSRRRTGAVLVVLALALAAAAAGYVVTRGWPVPADPAATGTSTTAPAPSTEAPADVDGDGETADEAVASDSADPTDGQVVATDEPVVVAGPQASVVVTYYGWNAAAGEVQVGGYVPGLVEEGGTCTLTLTRGGSTVTASTSGTPDAAATACGEVTVPGDRLSAGQWQAVLSYESGTASAVAPAVTVDVTL